MSFKILQIYKENKIEQNIQIQLIKLHLKISKSAYKL